MKDRESVTTNGRAVFYASIWNDLRQSAMDKGWALALHGSLANDMDIMAMPWVEGSSSSDEMMEALKSCFTESDLIRVTKTIKPNQRLVYTLSIWADFYLDINIIDLGEKNKGLGESSSLEEQLKRVIEKWDAQIALHRRVYEDALMYTKEDRLQNSHYAQALCAIVADLKSIKP